MYLFVKRIGDLLFSLLGLVFLLPLFGVLAILIRLDSKGSVFFVQNRVGKNKKIFKLYKFRSMRSDVDHNIPTHLLKDPKACVTKVGAFMRKTSLDELPQILNIIKGDMAIIGPRPALWNQDDLLAERDKYGANDVKPGLTGWAQINGRDELPIPVKAKLDGEYVERMSLWFDVKCFFLTFGAVFAQKGFVEGGTGALDSLCEQRTVEARGSL